MHGHRLLVITLGSLLTLACGGEHPVAPLQGSAVSAAAEPLDASDFPAAALNSAVEAAGAYRFHIPADFNGGIFGVAIDNEVSFVARRDAQGEVTGRFRYVQTVESEDFIFAGRITCLAIYDTPVLQRFPGIPAMSANRAKWGGVIEESNNPAQIGRYGWFQSIDNGSGPGQGHPDLSSLIGLGNEAANEAFCASANVPNPNFGPHAAQSGNILVQ